MGNKRCLGFLSLSALIFFLFASTVFAEAVYPQPNTTIAFIGDTGWGANFKQVLQLIKNEKADLVVHLGDFDYQDNPKGFEVVIDAELGESQPYLVVPGNHDNAFWKSSCNNGGKSCYAKIFGERYSQSGFPLTTNELDNEMYALEFQGVFIPVVGARGNQRDAYAEYLGSQLAADTYIWKVCAWHLNQESMQIGGKRDQMGWGTYDTCLQAGAIIATAHEHSYQRTKSLTQFHASSGAIVNTLYPDPSDLFVYPGSTFVFVSGAGGNGIRNQERCLPKEYPYGCNQEWAKIYTSNQQATYGALFIEFNPEGNPYQAKGYFKTITNELVDSFDITVPATLTPPILPTLTQSPPEPDPDIDGDADVDIFDFNALISFLNWNSCGHQLDLNQDCRVNMADYLLIIEAIKSWQG